jgi:large subunit ribosomal protein L21
MYAIVKVGGKQYRVEKGDSLLVDRMPDEEGATVRLKPLLLAPDGKDEPVFGSDALAKVKVEAKVAGHVRGPKIHVLKFKPKQGYKRRQGHRSELTRLEIGDIELLGRKSPASRKAAAPKGKDDAEKSKAAEPKAKADKPKAKADKPKAKADKPKDKADEGKGPEAEKQESGSQKVQGDKLEEATTKASPTTDKPGKSEAEEPAAPKEDSSDGS